MAEAEVLKILLGGVASLCVLCIFTVSAWLYRLGGRVSAVEYRSRDCEDNHERIAILEDRGGMLWRVLESRMVEGVPLLPNSTGRPRK